MGEHRPSGERKYYLSNLPADADLLTLAATIKARWVCEQAHQQMKEELGLDHFEGRSWHGLHRHALMTMIAFAFLQHRRLAARRGKKNRHGRRLSRACRGFLGIGAHHHTIPWDKLSYDREYSAYRTDLTAEQVHGAPVTYGNDEVFSAEREKVIHDYWRDPHSGSV